MKSRWSVFGFAGGMAMLLLSAASIVWACWPMQLAPMEPATLPANVMTTPARQAPSPARPDFPPLPSYQAIWQRFDGAAAVAVAAAAPANAPVRLVATATETQSPYAVFINKANGQVEVWRLGQSFNQVRLVKVEAHGVELQSAGQRWTLTVPQNFQRGP